MTDDQGVALGFNRVFGFSTLNIQQYWDSGGTHRIVTIDFKGLLQRITCTHGEKFWTGIVKGVVILQSVTLILPRKGMIVEPNHED